MGRGVVKKDMGHGSGDSGDQVIEAMIERKNRGGEVKKRKENIESSKANWPSSDVQNGYESEREIESVKRTKEKDSSHKGKGRHTIGRGHSEDREGQDDRIQRESDTEGGHFQRNTDTEDDSE
jgi:hypothetical protein